MSDEQVAPEAKGVAVELLATVDLGLEIQGMEGRQLRMRMVTIEPGGVFGPVHDHNGIPGTVYLLQGTITDHRDGIATDYGPVRACPRTGIPSTGSRKGRFGVFRGSGLALMRQTATGSGCARHRVVPPFVGTGCPVGSEPGGVVGRGRARGCVGGTSQADPVPVPGLRCRAGGL